MELTVGFESNIKVNSDRKAANIILFLQTFVQNILISTLLIFHCSWHFWYVFRYLFANAKRFEFQP